MTVFVAHAGLGDVVPGGFGVTVFFFLSGYLITSLLRLEYERTGRISLKNFYLRRIYRIIPPMYLVLTASILLGVAGLMSHAMTAQALVAQFAHLTNYYDLAVGSEGFAPGTAVMWSLSVEEHFYLLFPLGVSLLFARFRYERIAAILLLVCVIAPLWRCLLVAGLGVSDLYTYEASNCRHLEAHEHLADGPDGLGNVFQRVVSVDDVERAVRERKLSSISLTELDVLACADVEIRFDVDASDASVEPFS